MAQLLISLLVGLLPLAPQASSLRGVISDAQNALIADAVIVATNTETALSRTAASGTAGTFSFPQLPPGLYQIQVEKPGFGTFSAQVRLQIDTPASLDVRLDIGVVAETINVVGEAATVNTENASVGNPFTQTQVRQLPLQTRNVVELLSLQPGVSPTGEVIGAKRDQNNVTLDGVDVNDNQSSTGFNAALPVPLDSVQEFRTTVAGQGADQGRSAGGQVSLVTKSGSNEVHGSLYEFHRNAKTAANNWFNNRAGIPRENLIRNQYGASLGGPIVKDRAFFFVNWEDRKDRSASSVSRAVPAETLKQGILRFRMSNGQIGQFSPGEIKAIDPLKAGISPTMLAILNQYPAGNDPQGGSDRGLNFSAFRFNAPLRRDDRAYVAKFDFNLDRQGKHTLMLRGTLADNVRDETLAQFPGQDAASKLIDNSRGLALRYTAVIAPNLVSVSNYGFTRLGVTQSGIQGPSISFGGVASIQNFTRALTRIIPTTNLVNDTTWVKGDHTVQSGINFRFVQNDRTSFANSFASYSFSRNTLRGLGSDITTAATSFLGARDADATLRLTEATPVTNAFGTLLGVINQYSTTYNYGRDGKAIAAGAPTVRSFGTKEYEFYVQDIWKVKRDLTLTYGMRYSLSKVPFEKNGIEVITTKPLEQFFAERIGASMAGVPGFAMPNAALTYQLGGPANHGGDYFKKDTNNLAPRFSLAYAPENGSFLGKLFGRGSVLRAGGAVLYDRYGNDMVVNFDRSGSPGLATSVTQPRNTDFSDSVRYAGSALPALPAAPAGGFPFTPPTILGGFNSNVGVSSDIVAPYSFLLNLSYARPVPGHMTVEAGYIGRLGRKGLLQQDFFQPLTQFRDPKSGQTWAQAAGVLRGYYDAGLTAAQVRANPSVLPAVPFIENIFPGAAGMTFTGSATANYFFTTYGTYAASDLDALNQMDRERRADGTCISVYGCNTFFALQNAGMRAWVNAGNSSMHGGQLVIRRPVSAGWGFDFNYTLSHSIDIQSSAESGAGTGGAVIQDSFNPKSSRASSDFDIRHNISANSVVELPFGHRKALLSNAAGWLDRIVGGWQISTLVKYRSGLPLSISNGGVYPTNYLSSALAILKPGQSMPGNGLSKDQNGNPSLFRDTSAVKAFIGQYPGTVGVRDIVRGAPSFNCDLSIGKYFAMPAEGHRLQFRGEAFNAFNNVNFSSPGLSLANPATFGQFSGAADARVIQFALRYEF